MTGHPRILITLVAAGCGGSTVTFEGLKMFDVFPFSDSAKVSTYQSSDTSLPYRLRAEQLLEFETAAEEIRVYTIPFTIDCFGNSGICVDEDDVEGPDAEGELLTTWKMSADSRRGVQFHAVDDTTYDPPVKLAEPRMVEGETAETTTGGTDWVGTFVNEELCPAELYWPDPEVRPDCFNFFLDDGGSGSGIGGDYWSANRVGLVAFRLDADQGESWSLKNFVAEERR